MVYNAADQLTAWPGMHQYTYYPDGSLQEEKNADGSQVMKSYTYTADGLMATASFDGKTLTNTWDADKNRVGFSVDSTSHAFVYDTTAGIPAVVKEDGVYYVREPNGELLARVDGTNMSYYHFDKLGSTRLLTDANGNVTDKYDYDAYGAVIAHEKLAGSVDQPYQYVGQLGYYTCWQEPGFRLLQLGVRFYDAEVGRFGQRDSARRDSVSDYLYSSCSPLKLVDPSGRWPTKMDLLRMVYPCWAPCINLDQSIQGMFNPFKYPAKPPIDTTGNIHSNEVNAFGHCVRACKMAKLGTSACGGISGVRTYLNGIYEPIFWTQETKMDIINNNIGMALAGGPGTCADACFAKRSSWSVISGGSKRNLP